MTLHISTPSSATAPRSSRRGLLAGATALGAGLGLGALTGTAAASPGRAGEQRLRVATYNIHHGASPDGVLDLERIARAIDGFDADVIALQEVDRHWSDRSGLIDQTAWLSERLERHGVFGANLDQDPAAPGQPRRQYGTAVLSRWPILSWSNTLLPRYDGGEQRGLLRATVNVRGTRVRIAGTHLTHNNDAERLTQARRILDLLGEAPERTVLTGDLNAVPSSPEIGALTTRFRDAWSAGEGDGYTIPVLVPDRRIDYILASRDVRAVAAEVVHRDPAASDHLPLVTDLVLPRVVGA